MTSRGLALAILYGVAVVWGGYNLGRAAFGPKRGEDFIQHFVASRMLLEGKAALTLGSAEVYAERAAAYGVPPLKAGDEEIPMMASPYPPPVALLFAPFALLGFQAALEVFTLVNVAAAAVATALLFAGEPDRDRRRFATAAALGFTLLFFPLAYTLYMGQMNAILVALCVGALHLSRRGRDGRAGFCIALAITLKIFPAILLLFFLLKRRPKVIVSALAGVAALVAISLPWFPPAAYADYATRVLPESYVGGTWVRNQGLHGVLLRLLTENPHVAPLLEAPTLVRPLAMLGNLAILATLVTATRRRVAPASPRFAVELSLYLVAALLLLSKSWEHYGVFLLPAYLLLGERLLSEGARPARLFLLAASFSVWAFVLTAGDEYRALPRAAIAQPLFATKFLATLALFLVGIATLRDDARIEG